MEVHWIQMYHLSLVFSGYFVIPCTYRLSDVSYSRRSWRRTELSMTLLTETVRLFVCFFLQYFSALKHQEVWFYKNRAPCMAFSGISDRLYHVLAFLKRVIPCIKVFDTVPRVVYQTFFCKGIASSLKTFCEPWCTLDFCLWWMPAFLAFLALALFLPSFAATKQGLKAALSDLSTVCRLLWKEKQFCWQ